MDKITLLFLAANPRDTNRLGLDEEIRSITDKIRTSEHRDLLNIVSAWAVRADDLLQSLNEFKPHIVHFSGHGGLNGEIILADNNGKSKPVSKAALRSLFKALADNIQVVILNSCYSRVQAEAIAETIDCVIGMNTAIGDQAAIVFAASFYRAIGFGRSVQAAFEQGTIALQLEGIAERTTPELIVKRGVDPSKVFPLEHETSVIVDESQTFKHYAEVLEREFHAWWRLYSPLHVADKAPTFPLYATSWSRASSTEPTDYPAYLLEQALADDDHLVIVGEGGVGKTTALRYFALQQARLLGSGAANVRIPVYIELSAYTPHYKGDLIDLIQGKLGIANVDRDALEKHLKAGHFTLALDGLNEVAEVRQSDIIGDLTRIVESTSAYRNNRIIVATRLHGYNGLLGLKTVQIQPLGKDDIVDFVNRYFEGDIAIGQRLLYELELENPSRWEQPQAVLHLARNPLNLWFIVELFRQYQQLPSDRGKLLLQFVKWRFGNWEEQHGKVGSFDYYDKRPLLARLAFETAKMRAGVRVKRTFAERLFVRQRGKDGRRILREVISNGVLREAGEDVEWIHQRIQSLFTAISFTDSPERLLQVLDLMPPPRWTLQEVLSSNGFIRFLPVNLLSGEFEDAVAIWFDLAENNGSEIIGTLLDKHEILLAIHCYSILRDNGGDQDKTLARSLAHRLMEELDANSEGIMSYWTFKRETDWSGLLDGLPEDFMGSELRAFGGIYSAITNAVCILGMLAGPDIFDIILEEFHRAQPFVPAIRASLVTSLGFINQPESIDLILGALNDANMNVRSDACYALARLHNSDSGIVSALIDGLNESKNDAYPSFVAALSALLPEQEAEGLYHGWVRQLDDERVPVEDRCRALVQFSRFSPTRSLGRLNSILSDTTESEVVIEQAALCIEDMLEYKKSKFRDIMQGVEILRVLDTEEIERSLNAIEGDQHYSPKLRSLAKKVLYEVERNLHA